MTLLSEILEFFRRYWKPFVLILLVAFGLPWVILLAVLAWGL